MSIASNIRRQLAAQPTRKTFRKSRGILLELVVENECLHKALEDAARESTLRASKSRERALIALLGRAKDELYAPDKNCSCHRSPPCSDCVNYAHIRELIADIDEATAASIPSAREDG